MNILYLCDEYPPGRHGGIGTSVQALAREVAKKGHKVIVAGFYDWGYGGEDEFDDMGVKVYRFRRGLASKIFSNQNALIVRALYRLLTISGIFEWDIKRSLKKYHAFLEKMIYRYKIDIIEMPDYNDYMRFCNSYVPFPKLSVPVIVKMNGCMTYFAEEANKVVPGHIEKMEHDLLQQTNEVAAVSKYTASKTAQYLNYEKKIEVLHNGIDTHIHFRKQINKEAYRIVYTGSLVQKKGIYQLIKAWNIVKKSVPEATMWIFGKGNTSKLKEMIDNDILSSVSFQGHVGREALMEYLAEASIAVFPSYAECFALAPMEAMVCGTAVIYTERASGPELIENNIDGILIDPDDVEQIAEKIIYLLLHPQVCSEMAQKGQQKVNTFFDVSIIANKNIKFYQKTIDQSQ